MGLADLPVAGCSGSTSTAADEHQLCPLMLPPEDELPSDRMLYGRPVAVSGAIIRKPRSRKQGVRAQSNATAAENATEMDVASAGEDVPTWQPLVTESTISTLLDNLSVAASDNEMSETILTSCDIRLHTSTSTPFVTLERADLSRCVIGHAGTSVAHFIQSLLLCNHIRLYSLDT